MEFEVARNRPQLTPEFFATLNTLIGQVRGGESRGRAGGAAAGLGLGLVGLRADVGRTVRGASADAG